MAGHTEVALTRGMKKQRRGAGKTLRRRCSGSLLICLRTRRNDAGREQVGEVVRVGGVAEIR